MRLFAVIALAVLTLVAAPKPGADAATNRQQQASTRPVASTPATQARPPAAERPAAQRSTPRATTQRAPTQRATTQRATTQRATTQRATTQRGTSAAAARNRATPSRNRAVSATAPTRNTAACERRDNRGRCVGPRTASWQGGLPIASNTQADCPAGTMATLARGHSSVIRCLPL